MNLEARKRKGEKLIDHSYSLLMKHLVLPAGDRVLGQNMVRRLAFLEEAQWWSPEDVRAYQEAQLRKLIKVAYEEVQFYRDLMDSAGVKPADIGRVEDLRKLPVVTKQMFRKVFPEGTSRDTGRKTWEACSSGSTGTNFCALQDRETMSRLLAMTTLAFGWGGWPIGDRHLQTGISPQRGFVKKVKDILLRCTYWPAFDLTDAIMDAALDTMHAKKIRHLRGYPGSLYFLARRALETGRGYPLDSILTWGDNLFDYYRATIEKAFSRRIYDTYGCAEGIQVAAQCGEGMNYHTYSTEVVVETLDDEGRPTEPGVSGHVILTRLHPGPMPFIRYRVGDMAVRGGESRCPCGRGFELFGSIQGRDTDFILTPSGNRLIVHFFTRVFEYCPEVDSFQVIQETRDSMILRLVPMKNYTNAVGESIVQSIRDLGAADMKIDVELVDEIPLAPSHKRRFVISKLPKPELGVESRSKQP